MELWNKARACRPLPLALLLLLGACKTDGLESFTAMITDAVTGAVEAEAFPIVAMEGKGRESLIAAGESDLRKVLQAAVARLRGHSEARISDSLGVSLMGQAEPPLSPLAGFTVAQARVTTDPVISVSAPVRAMAGLFDFQDSAGRHALFGFSGSFRSGGEVVTIGQLDLFPLYTAAPEPELFVVPVAALEKLDGKTLSDYRAFRRSVLGAALEVRRLAALPKGPTDYAFVSFIKDRLAPGERVQMSLVRSRKAKSGDGGQSHYRAYEGGWVVAILRRELDLASGKAGWIRMTAVPPAKGSAASRKPRIIGLFRAGPQPPLAQQSHNPKSGG